MKEASFELKINCSKRKAKYLMDFLCNLFFHTCAMDYNKKRYLEVRVRLSWKILSTRLDGISNISSADVSRWEDLPCPICQTWINCLSIVFGTVHQNYVGIDSEKNPYFLSVVSQDSGSKYMPLYRVILFRKQVRNEQPAFTGFSLLDFHLTFFPFTIIIFLHWNGNPFLLFFLCSITVIT